MTDHQIILQQRKELRRLNKLLKKNKKCYETNLKWITEDRNNLVERVLKLNTKLSNIYKILS